MSASSFETLFGRRWSASVVRDCPGVTIFSASGERPKPSSRRICCVTIALTVFAGPLYQLCASIGDALLTPVTLVQLEQEAQQ